MFTFRMEPQVIRIHAPGAAVVRDNCIRCHEPLFTNQPAPHGGDRACWDCHREVPHGLVNSLASVPLTANTPTPDPVAVPGWLSRLLDAREKPADSPPPKP